MQPLPRHPVSTSLPDTGVRTTAGDGVRWVVLQGEAITGIDVRTRFDSE